MTCRKEAACWRASTLYQLWLADLVSAKAVDRMLADAEQAGLPLDGPDGLLNQLIKAAIERALGAELDDIWGM
jgi:putative transposase